ncbi:hypothetical protein TWF696_005958 [Orbilia brochopaga]|uniref:Nucleoside phosphorylase domain-containing protein n=1 Tax=Orbilia brochopaga TaxID=3140254 RepID=A0AAV9UXT6_9PEZI
MQAPEPRVEEYTVGWICVVQAEHETACQMLDQVFDGPEQSNPLDENTYVFGRIHKHNVVIGRLPAGQYGTNAAAVVANDMVRSFTKLRFILLVGIAGGAPTNDNDVRLGDVVVSVPRGTLGGVVQLDFVKRHRLANGEVYLERMGQLNSPPRVLLGAIPEVHRRRRHPKEPDRIAENMARMADWPEYQKPAEDRLYRSDYAHQGGPNCDNCDTENLEPWSLEERTYRSRRAVAVHYGTIGSSNSLMQDVEERDRCANDPSLKILCFETEAAGLMNTFPCLVIRGIWNYSDSHKTDAWRNYAALAAAAYARELLSVLKPQKVVAQPALVGLCLVNQTASSEDTLSSSREKIAGLLKEETQEAFSELKSKILIL